MPGFLASKIYIWVEISNLRDEPLILWYQSSIPLSSNCKCHTQIDPECNLQLIRLYNLVYIYITKKGPKSCRFENVVCPFWEFKIARYILLLSRQINCHLISGLSDYDSILNKNLVRLNLCNWLAEVHIFA